MARPPTPPRLTKAATRASTRTRTRTSIRRRSSAQQGGFVRTPPPDDTIGLDDGGGGGGGGDPDDSGDNGSGFGGGGGLPFDRRKRKYVKAADRPGQCRGFYIARVISHTDKVGDEEDPPGYVDLDEDTNADFRVKLGDFVLVLSPPKTLRVSVRNYRGQEGKLPRRMLQDVFNPWSIPPNIRLDDSNGIPFPLRFTREELSRLEGDGTAFEADEAVMVMRTSQNPLYCEVVDYERKPGSILQTQLRKRYVVPWNLRVDQDAFESRYKLRSARAPRRSRAVIGDEAFEELLRGRGRRGIS